MLRRSQRLIEKQRINQKSRIPPSLPKYHNDSESIKKNSRDTFKKHRPTVLDLLPMDVISLTLFPLLDYESRINLNLCLPAWDRISTRMNPASIIKHHHDYCCSHIVSILSKLNEKEDDYSERLKITGKKRILKVIELLNNFKRKDYLLIYTNSAKVREVTESKLSEFLMIYHDDTMKEFSKSIINKLKITCRVIRRIFASVKDNLEDHGFKKIPSLVFH
jgi:hypothetical protein